MVFDIVDFPIDKDRIIWFDTLKRLYDHFSSIHGEDVTFKLNPIFVKQAVDQSDMCVPYIENISCLSDVDLQELTSNSITRECALSILNSSGISDGVKQSIINRFPNLISKINNINNENTKFILQQYPHYIVDVAHKMDQDLLYDCIMDKNGSISYSFLTYDMLKKNMNDIVDGRVLHGLSGEVYKSFINDPNRSEQFFYKILCHDDSKIFRCANIDFDYYIRCMNVDSTISMNLDLTDKKFDFLTAERKSFILKHFFQIENFESVIAYMEANRYKYCIHQYIPSEWLTREYYLSLSRLKSFHLIPFSDVDRNNIDDDLLVEMYTSMPDILYQYTKTKININTVIKLYEVNLSNTPHINFNNYNSKELIQILNLDNFNKNAQHHQYSRVIEMMMRKQIEENS